MAPGHRPDRSAPRKPRILEWHQRIERCAKSTGEVRFVAAFVDAKHDAACGRESIVDVSREAVPCGDAIDVKRVRDSACGSGLTRCKELDGGRELLRQKQLGALRASVEHEDRAERRGGAGEKEEIWGLSKPGRRYPAGAPADRMISRSLPSRA